MGYRGWLPRPYRKPYAPTAIHDVSGILTSRHDLGTSNTSDPFHFAIRENAAKNTPMFRPSALSIFASAASTRCSASAAMAQWHRPQNCQTGHTGMGIPKTIDNDLVEPM